MFVLGSYKLVQWTFNCVNPDKWNSKKKNPSLLVFFFNTQGFYYSYNMIYIYIYIILEGEKKYSKAQTEP